MGQIQGDTKAFSARMKEHSDEMRTVANVKAMEQYKKMLDQFKFQLDDRNAKVAKQTRNAAMAQGYVQVGDKFIKKGATAGVYGVVNAYEYFDTEGEFIKALSETGVDSVNGEGLVTFLKEKSQIEVTAYFHTQKLAIQSAMNKLMGTGDASVRESSRDARDIGRIGVWIGGQGNSDLANRTLTEMNKQGLFSRDAYMRDLLANNAMFGGFGQLGSATWRPGEKQILGGFYTQLSWMGGEMGKRDAANTNSRFAADPVTATLNQFNVGSMYANSYKNVELAHAINGKSRGYMWEAQGLLAAKQAAGALATAVSTVPVIGALIAVPIRAAGKSIKVDPVTGKRTFKLTEKEQMTLAASAAAAIATIGFSGYGEATVEIVQLLDQITQVALQGAQTDEKGNLTGDWAADESFWTNAIVAGVSMGAETKNNSFRIKNGLASLNEDQTRAVSMVISKAMTNGYEYYKFKNNQSNRYEEVSEANLGNLGELFGMLGGSLSRDGLEGGVEDWARDQRNQGHQNNQASDSILGMAYAGIRRRREQPGNSEGGFWDGARDGFLSSIGLGGLYNLISNYPEIDEAMDVEGGISKTTQALEDAQEQHRKGDRKKALSILQEGGLEADISEKILSEMDSNLTFKETDFRNYTNFTAYINKLAKYYDVSPEVIKASLLRANGTDSLQVLVKRIRSGKTIKEQTDFQWTQHFQNKNYADHDAQVIAASNLGMSWVKAARMAKKENSSVETYLKNYKLAKSYGYNYDNIIISTARANNEAQKLGATSKKATEVLSSLIVGKKRIPTFRKEQAREKALKAQLDEYWHKSQQRRYNGLMRSVKGVMEMYFGVSSTVLAASHGNMPFAYAGMTGTGLGGTEFSNGIIDMFSNEAPTPMLFQTPFDDPDYRNYAGFTQELTTAILSSLGMDYGMGIFNAETRALQEAAESALRKIFEQPLSEKQSKELYNSLIQAGIKEKQAKEAIVNFVETGRFVKPDLKQAMNWYEDSEPAPFFRTN